MPEISPILFLNMLVVLAPPIEIPATVDEVVVLESEVIVLLLILISVEVLEHEIPMTLPPVPVEVKFVMVLFATVIEVALFVVLPMVMPMTTPWPVIFEIVLLDKLETPFQYVIFMVLIVPVPPVQLLKMFPVIVLVDPLPPSVLLKPVMVVLPATVIFEKLLFV